MSRNSAKPRRSVVLQALGQGYDRRASWSELSPQHQAQIAKRCTVIEIGRLDALGGSELAGDLEHPGRGIDADHADAGLAGHSGDQGPRDLRTRRVAAGMRDAVLNYASLSYVVGERPDVDIVRARLQKAVDQVLGKGEGEVEK